MPYEANDIAFLGVVHPEHGPGFDLWVGGGLSTNPMLAQRLGAWVPLDEVPEVWAGVVGGLPRLRLPPAAQPGAAEVPGRRLGRGAVPRGAGGRVPAAASSSTGRRRSCREQPIDHIGVHRQRDGRYYVGVAPVAGRVSGSQLAQLADLAEAHGSGRVRLTPYQKLLVLDVAEDRVESLVAGLRAIGLRGRARPAWRRDTMACTGIEFCKLAIVETKAARPRTWWRTWRRGSATSTRTSPSTSTAARTPAPAPRSPTSGSRASSCPARTASMVEGFQIHLGGGLALAQGQEAGFGRKLRGLKTTAEELPGYVERVARRYLAGRDDGRAVRAVGAAGGRGGLR